jgi:hypothetical protein
MLLIALIEILQFLNYSWRAMRAPMLVIEALSVPS